MKYSLRITLLSVAIISVVAITTRGWSMGGDNNGGNNGRHAGYIQTNLVSDDNSKIPANHEDPTLLNPWGVAFAIGGPFWINDNGSGLSALYQGDGTGFGGADPAPAVTVPTPDGTGTSAPTGIVWNGSFGFTLKDSNPA